MKQGFFDCPGTYLMIRKFLKTDMDIKDFDDRHGRLEEMSEERLEET